MSKSEFEKHREELLNIIKDVNQDTYDSLFTKHEFTFVDMIEMISEAEAYAYNYAKENAKEALDEERAKALVSVIEDVLTMGFSYFQEELMEKYCERR